MAFDPNQHEIDPHTGFQIDKDSGLVTGIFTRAHGAPLTADPNWPAWVVPNESHVVRKKTEGAPDSVSMPGWQHYHVNRLTGEVTVLVADEDEAKRAQAEKSEDEHADNGDDIDPRILRQVRVEFEQRRAVQAAQSSKELADEQAKAVIEEARRRSQAKRDLDAKNREAADKAASEARARLNERFGDVSQSAATQPVQVPSTVAPILGDQPQDIDIGVAGSAFAGAQAKASTERAEQAQMTVNKDENKVLYDDQKKGA